MTAHDPSDWMWNEACALIERATRVHRQFLKPGLPSAPSPNWEPPIDIFETDHAVHIVAALPGVEAQDLAITVEGNEIVISGLRRLPPVKQDAVIHRLEIPYGRFERHIRLAKGRLELVRSELASGCLSLHLTKRF
jgi:HSP20 family protein